MSTSQWAVLAAGGIIIAAINWWFFVAQPAARGVVAPASGGAAEVTIVVQGGYDPALVRVPAATPLRLVFDRRETSGCSEEVVFPALGVRRFLTPMAKTVVELPALAAGRQPFTCGMSMLHGALDVVAEPARD